MVYNYWKYNILLYIMSQLFINESLLFIYNNIDDILFIAYILLLLSFILHYLGFKAPEKKNTNN